MPINANILMSGTQLQMPQQDPNAGMNALVRAMQIKDMQGNSRLNALKIQEAERGIATESAIGEAWRNAIGPDGKVNRNRLIETLATGGHGAKIPTIQKQFSDADTAAAAAFKAAGENYGAFQKELGAEFNNPNVSKQGVLQRIALRVQAGAMDPGLAERMAAALPDDPVQLRGALRQMLTSQMPTELMLTAFAPKPEKIDNGQQIGFRDTNPNSPTYGQNTGGAPVQKVMTPGEVASDSRARAQLDETKRHHGVTEKNQASTLAQGKIPPGYRQKADGTLEAIPGGPADIKAGEAGAKRELQQQGAVAQADRVISKVDSALEKVGIMTAGPGSILAKVPGTPARNLQTTLDTIKANLGFAELQAMRAASPTGGALGAIAVQELIALQSTVASLDQAQSPAELENSLGQVKKHYEAWKKTVQSAGKPQNGGASGGWGIQRVN